MLRSMAKNYINLAKKIIETKPKVSSQAVSQIKTETKEFLEQYESH